jgi:protein Tex
MKPIAERIAEELNVRPAKVAAAIGLLDAGATVPFIARYRKEATGALDDTELRTLETRLAYLRELDDRRKTILESIREQGKLDAALEAQIHEAESKARLEDIYQTPHQGADRQGEWARAACGKPSRPP